MLLSKSFVNVQVAPLIFQPFVDKATTARVSHRPHPLSGIFIRWSPTIVHYSCDNLRLSILWLHRPRNFHLRLPTLGPLQQRTFPLIQVSTSDTSGSTQILIVHVLFIRGGINVYSRIYIWKHSSTNMSKTRAFAPSGIHVSIFMFHLRLSKFSCCVHPTYVSVSVCVA